MPSNFRVILISVIIFAFALENSAFNSLPMSEKKLQKVHEALFDTFVPFSKQEIDTTLAHLLHEAKIASFNKAIVVPHFRYALFLLNNLHLLHNRLFLRLYYRVMTDDKEDLATVNKQSLKPIKKFLKSVSRKRVRLSVKDLTPLDRFRLFHELIHADVNVLRLVGFYVRMFYTNAVYDGPLSEKISQLKDKGNVEADIVPSLPKFSTHLIYDRKKHRLLGHLDALIIGSGPSGAVAAYEFQKHQLTVLVVESGSMVIPGAIDTTSDLRFMEGGAPRLSEDGSIALLNGATVGGGSTINLDMSFAPTLPFVRHRFHRWHEENLIAKDLWSDQEIDKAFRWVKEIFEPRTIDFKEINANNSILINGAFILGIPYRYYQLNHYAPEKSPHQVYNKKSSLEKLLLPAMTPKFDPVTLLSDCRVTRVLVKHKRARGVECIYEPKNFGVAVVHDLYGFNIKPKTKIKIYADNVILAAGNLGTSTILLNSKIDNQNIGRGFVAHPFISLMGRFDHVIRADVGEPSTVFVDHFMQTDKHPNRPGYLIEPGLGRLSLWALLMPGLPSQVRNNFASVDHVGGFSVMLTDTPNDHNRVELGRDGQIKVHYRLSDDDRLKLIDGVKTSVKLLFAGGANEVSFNTFEYPLFQSGGMASTMLTPDMNLDEVFQKFHLTRNQTSLLGAHMMGGNKIGIDKKTSVVNSDYQVWGVNNLFVIDSSIFPGSVGANPMQTIYTCAKIFTERFLYRYRKSYHY